MLRKTIFGSLAALTGTAAYGVYTSNDTIYNYLIMPVAQMATNPEDAHRLAVNFLSLNLHQNQASSKGNDSVLVSSFAGKILKNPIGIAAGFDKNAECFIGLSRLGFGFVEVGSITPLPQPGNERPRVFRLPEDHAVINRYGFNSSGHEAALRNIVKADEASPAERKSMVLGVNLGKNKTSLNAKEDYIIGVKRFYDVCDYLVINVSSPNTPGLRSLQKRGELKDIIAAVILERDSCAKLRPNNSLPKPIFVKIAPDLTEEDKRDIAAVALESLNHNFDGLIISNTTITRDNLKNHEYSAEVGGLSGEPVKAMSSALIKDMYELTQGKLTIIGVGGVSSGQDALDKIKNGATYVQLYTSMAYSGPPIAKKVIKELEELVKEEHVENYKHLVGVNCNLEHTSEVVKNIKTVQRWTW